MMYRRATTAALVAIAAACLAGCGSTSTAPTSPSPGGETSAVFDVFPDTVLLGPGDRGFLVALFAANVNLLPQDVTAATRWESSNPAVVSLQGGTLTSLSPGEADLRGSYQGRTESAHVSVFAATAVRAFSMRTALECWPGETFSWNTDVTLDTGVRVSPSAVTWRTLDERMASVTTTEEQVSTGNISSVAEVICRSAGTTRIEATYAGRTATTIVTVRAPRDVIEIRGGSEGNPAPGVRTNGVTVFYLLDSAPSAQIRFESRDVSDLTRVLGVSLLAVQRGGGRVSLENSWQGPAVTVCEVVDLIIPGAPAIRAAGSCSPPAPQH